MFKVPRILRMRAMRMCSHFPRHYPRSQTPIAIMIPLAEKDLGRVARAVESLRLHVLHPISEIVIAGQDSDKIRAFCAASGLRYVCENDVLPAWVNEPRLTPEGGLRVRGWVRQQLLKLTVFDWIDAQNVLVHDADNCLLHDVSYFEGERQVLYLSDEFTKVYQVLLDEALGPFSRHHRSFVTHFMLLQRDLVSSLDAHVMRQQGLSLTDFIATRLDMAHSSMLSEFELYGNFLNTFHPARFVTRYWFGRNASDDSDASLAVLRSKYPGMNFVATHEH